MQTCTCTYIIHKIPRKLLSVILIHGWNMYYSVHKFNDKYLFLSQVTGQEKTQVRLPRASKFHSVAQWASEISLSNLVGLIENVSLMNNFQSEAISKLKRLQD